VLAGSRVPGYYGGMLRLGTRVRAARSLGSWLGVVTDLRDHSTGYVWRVKWSTPSGNVAMFCRADELEVV
jgi:hypothetical protein